jgi:hypothetical protein
MGLIAYCKFHNWSSYVYLMDEKLSNADDYKVVVCFFHQVIGSLQGFKK